MQVGPRTVEPCVAMQGASYGARVPQIGAHGSVAGGFDGALSVTMVLQPGRLARGRVDGASSTGKIANRSTMLPSGSRTVA